MISEPDIFEPFSLCYKPQLSTNCFASQRHYTHVFRYLSCYDFAFNSLMIFHTLQDEWFSSAVTEDRNESSTETRIVSASGDKGRINIINSSSGKRNHWLTMTFEFPSIIRPLNAFVLEPSVISWKLFFLSLFSIHPTYNLLSATGFNQRRFSGFESFCVF